MASDDSTTTPDTTPEPTQPAAAGADHAPATEGTAAPRKRSTRSLESRQAAAKKAAATRARKKAEAAARLAAEQPGDPEDAPTSPAPTDEAFVAAAPEASLPGDDEADQAQDARDVEVSPLSQPPVDAQEAVSGLLTDPMDDPVVRAARAREAQEETRPVVPSFGLLFQAPDPEEVLDLRAASGRDDDADDGDDDVDDDTDDGGESRDGDSRGDSRGGGTQGDRRAGGGRGNRGRGDGRADGAGRGPATSDDTRGSERSDRVDDTDDVDDSGDDDSSASRDGRDDDSDGNRRRRRRGGRGRRRPSGRGGEDGADASEDRDDEGRGKDESGREGRGDDDRRRNRGSDDQGDGDESAEDTRRDGGRGGDPADQGEGESTGRRRRRRRRSGSAGDSDDPPGTVTKVREPRDSATGIKGSTRLEAKRQRRREGREAGRRRTIITEAEFLARRESVERVMVVRERGPHTQIGVLEDGILVEHYISGGGTAQGAAGAPGASMAGNVYLGRVQNVLPSMEAAFVDIGRGRNAVLYAGEVNWDAAGLEQHKARRIENALSNGQSVLVQVTKDPIGHKGARLTSQVSLPGRYLVYVPDGSMTGISRKLPDTERARLKKILKQIVPDDAGVIVRTAAEGASEAELTADVERLQRAWAKIQKKAKTGNAPVLLHGEADLTTRVVRDVFNEDFTKLVVHGDGAWDSISDYVESVAPDLADRLERWTGEKDVFAAYRVDEQIAKAMDRKVWLPSGGSLVIDRTEAMTVIDVNTGKFTGSGGNLEETVTKNNIEAAEEIVRQLRLRDIGGIIVVDFIDMVLESNRELVVRRLVECLGRDRTKHQVAEVTSLGLVQMTRKRVGAGLIEVFSEECEHCHGRGIHVSTEPLEKSTDSGDGGRDDRRGGRRNDRARREVRGSGSGRDQRDPRESRDSRDQRDPSPATPSGPTPAQIAAAAYAAAVQSHGSGEARSEGEDAPMETAAVEAIVAEHLEGSEVPVPTADDARDDAPTIAEPGSTGSAGSAGSTGRRRGSRRASSPSAAPAAPVVEPGSPVVSGELGTDAAPATGRVTGKVTGRVQPPASAAAAEPHDGDESSVSSGEADELPTSNSGAVGADSPIETPAASATPAQPRRRGARRAASAPTAAPSGAAPAVFTAEEATAATEALASSEPKTVAAAAASDGQVQSQTQATEADTPAEEAPAAPKRRRAARRAAGSPAGPPRSTEGE